MVFDLQVHALHEVEYLPTWQAMKAFTAQRNDKTPDVIWVCQHNPVFTLGLAGKQSHILHRSPIPIIQTDRGGQVTYHGPGQLVVYPLLNLRRYGLKVREYVSLLEDCVLDVLTGCGLEHVQRQAGAPGVYVGWNIEAQRVQSVAEGGTLAKIAALGIKVQRGFSYHGLALNVDMNLEPFQWINPCGYAGMHTVDLRLTGAKITTLAVEAVLVETLVRKLKELCRD